MSDLMRNRWLKHWLMEDDSQLKIDGAEAADDDIESGYLSVSHDHDQSSHLSFQSLRSDRSKKKKINFQRFEKYDPGRYYYWQCLQEEKKHIQIREERFLADLPPDCFLSDDDQWPRPFDPFLRSDRSKEKIINFQKLKQCDPLMDQYWQSLQELRKFIQIREASALARISTDFFLRDDDQSSCLSDLSLHSDWSKGKIINFKRLEKSNAVLYQAWQRLQELRELFQIEEESVFDDLPPDWMEEEEEEVVEAEEEEEEEEEGVEAEGEEEEEVVEAEGEEEEETKSVI
ncbi:uncharacterized protein [Labrus bergylta]|uniref:uncharacterized protein n=1 Tax=Labrus bergylta TaxID=56723 RepID=UPI0033144571